MKVQCTRYHLGVGEKEVDDITVEGNGEGSDGEEVDSRHGVDLQ